MSTDSREQSQNRAVACALAYVLPRALCARRPADRELAAYLRGHPECGSRDRRRIGDAVYSVLRWWGWLEPLAPAGWNDPAAAPAAPDWQPLLEGAAAAETADRNALEALLSSRHLPHELSLRQLAPDWLPSAIDCPRPYEALVEALQRRPPLWLRVQHADAGSVLRELGAAGLAPVAHARAPMAVNVGHARVNLLSLPAYRERRVEVQDLASQAVGLTCAPRRGERWWDVCAGAGGKALHLAALMGPGGRVLASDTRPAGLAELAERARYAGLTNVRTIAREDVDADTRFDGVLVDAPCSGSGTWHRSPWGRWQTSREDVSRLAVCQFEILSRAAVQVRPGGVLVYATCSFFRDENDGCVARFLDASPDFAPDPVPHPFTGDATGGRFQLWPWDGDCDAFFIARLRRSA